VTKTGQREAGGSETIIHQGMAAGRQTEASAQSPETIEELFAALESPLLNYALRLIRGREIAEDLVQEAFMKLHKHFEEVREPRRWLYRTVHNMALNHRRNNAKIVPLQPQRDETDAPAADTTDPQPLPDEQIIRMEGIGQVRLSLAALDERSRELVRLKFHDDLSYRDISARMGISVSNVGYILHQALKTIASELAKTGVVP
jgi:RNA polymerase sigma factor (sigma-70 family)